MYKLSPSDFAYLYEECKLCYYLKIKYGIYQPSMPMPGVFSVINSKIQEGLATKKLKFISSKLPNQKIDSQEGWVESIVIPNTDVFIKGIYDMLIKSGKDTHTLVDLKIAMPGKDKIEKYQIQPNAYKFALEHPKVGKPLKIDRLGLLMAYPDAGKIDRKSAVLNFPIKWFEVPVNNVGFLRFIKGVNELLSGPPPNADKNCMWCRYRNLQKAPLSLEDVLSKGENENVEFKSSLRWDDNEKQVSKSLEHKCLKTIAAFLNFNGGKLYIGVNNSGKIQGIKKDIESLKQGTVDKFELYLNQILINAFGKEFRQYIHVSFEESKKGNVCIVTSEPSETPVYMKVGGLKEFYIRSGNSTQQLDTEEAVNYIRKHWDSF